MKLSTVLTDYRNRFGISQRELARRCDLSNSYISFIENEFNPRTGKPIVPTLEQYKKMASGMDMSVQQLFEMLDDDAPVDLHFPVYDASDYHPMTPEARILVKGIDSLSQEDRQQLLEVARLLFKNTFDKEDPNGTEL